MIHFNRYNRSPHQMESIKVTFFLLCGDLFEHLCRFLPIRDVLRLARVCWTLNRWVSMTHLYGRIVDVPEITLRSWFKANIPCRWNIYAHLTTPESVCALSNSGKKLSAVRIGKMVLFEEGIPLDTMQVNSVRIEKHRTLGSNDNVYFKNLGLLLANEFITRLHLSGIPLGDKGAGLIAGSQYLTYLNLQNTGITDNGAYELAKTLSPIKVLNLRENKIGTDGAVALSGIPTLEWLDLSWNMTDNWECIGPRGAAALAVHRSLTFLSLKYGKIGDEGAKALANSGITTFELCRKDIGVDGLKLLEDSKKQLLLHGSV